MVVVTCCAEPTYRKVLALGKKAPTHNSGAPANLLHQQILIGQHHVYKNDSELENNSEE
jgi:hypothetical protein